MAGPATRHLDPAAGGRSGPQRRGVDSVRRCAGAADPVGAQRQRRVHAGCAVHHSGHRHQRRSRQGADRAHRQSLVRLGHLPPFPAGLRRGRLGPARRPVQRHHPPLQGKRRGPEQDATVCACHAVGGRRLRGCHTGGWPRAGATGGAGRPLARAAASHPHRAGQLGRRRCACLPRTRRAVPPLGHGRHRPAHALRQPLQAPRRVPRPVADRRVLHAGRAQRTLCAQWRIRGRLAGQRHRGVLRGPVHDPHHSR